MTPESILRWYLDAGVDETIGEMANNRLAAPSVATAAPVPRSAPAVASQPAPSRATAPPPSPVPSQAGATAAHLAMGCRSLDELRAAIETYDGCALRRTCQRTVFADGNPAARVMLVGEAPGADEDRVGLPFVGASGRLLDRMLASIGLDRQSAYITNVVPWRPPGNRKPEPTEIELCLPFVERHIELIDPAVLVLLGGAAAAALLGRTEGISKLRGRWMDYASPGLARPVPALATFHPAYLLRTPLHKREAWRDLVAVRKRLDTLANQL